MDGAPEARWARSARSAAFWCQATGAPPAGGLPGGVTLPPRPEPVPNPLDDITPVTDAMLSDPPPEDWLTWRRTQNAFGYSPLDDIDRDNVGDLRVAWSWSLPPGSAEVAPLVHDGVIFVHGHGDIVQALNAATGDMLWQYSHWARGGGSPSVKRSIALGGELLYLRTSDGRIVALDVRTGAVVWDQQVTDDERFAMTAGPLVAQGKVMIGTTGRVPGGNYIVGLDAATGEEMWRWWTIARPGEPGGESWNGLLLEERNGGSIWVPGTYDAELGLAYFGVARYFTAFDSESGEPLWQVRLSDVPNSPPISYTANGKQYVALTAGHGGGISVDRTPLIPEVRLPSSSAPVVWAFELPEQ